MEAPPQARYLILGADGKEYGPVSGEQIHQWIDEGRANAASRARVEGQEGWRNLSEFPEFAEAVAARPPAFEPGAGSDEAPTPLPADLLERDYDLSVGNCLSRGFELFTSRFGLVFAAGAIFLGVQLLLTLLSMIPILGSLVSLASFVVYGPLVGGLYFFLLKVMRNQPAQVGDVFCGFQRCAVHLILCYIVMMILTAIAAAPGGVIVAVGAIPQIFGNEVQPILMVVAGFGALICLAGVLFVTVCWMFALALIIDKRMEFWPAMETSRKVVMKHWWKCFLLYLVAGLLNLAGMLVCCVGLFFTLPLSFATMMFAYEDVFCRPSPQSA
jgi:uncharacterized membrane protein